MLIISYDISNDKLRHQFAKMLIKNGAIRLQYSVNEVNNTKRVIDNIIVKVNSIFARKFCADDSVIIFNVDHNNVIKYGNAIHRDTAVVYF